MTSGHRPTKYRSLSDKEILALAAQYSLELIAIDVSAIVPEILAAFPKDKDLAEAIVKSPEHAQSPADLLLSQVTGIPPIMLDYITVPYHGDVLEPFWGSAHETEKIVH